MKPLADGEVVFDESQFIDAEVLAEVEAENINASKAGPWCDRCDDTGIIEHNKGWRDDIACTCATGREVLVSQLTVKGRANAIV